jgi:hypothetical protein
MIDDNHSTESNIGVGVTGEFSLRVSVACLARVILMHPHTGERMLALEHTATLIENDVIVRVRPFGGACRLRLPNALRDLIGDFHFDSPRSRSERDFRIVIRPSDWDTVRQFCLRHLESVNDLVLESNPNRELVEEFADALKMKLKREQYVLRPAQTIVEREPAPTENIHASGHPTIRIYRVFETRIVDAALAAAILENSDRFSAERLEQLAWEDVRNGGKGRANAVFASSMQFIHDLYAGLAPAARHLPVIVGNDRFHGNLPALLEDVFVPLYERL